MLRVESLFDQEEIQAHIVVKGVLAVLLEIELALKRDSEIIKAPQLIYLIRSINRIHSNFINSGDWGRSMAAMSRPTTDFQNFETREIFNPLIARFRGMHTVLKIVGWHHD